MRAIALAMSAVFRFIGHPFVRTLNALIVRILPILYLIVFMCFVAVVHVSGPTVFIQFPGCEFVFHLRGASPPPRSFAFGSPHLLFPSPGRVDSRRRSNHLHSGRF